MTHRLALFALPALLLSVCLPRPAHAEDTAVRLELTGSLADAAVVEDADGSQSLALLVLEDSEADEGAPARPRLYRFDPSSRTLRPWPGLPDALPLGSRELLPAGAGLWIAATPYGRLDLIPVSTGAVVHHDLPRRAQRRSWGLRLTSPSPRPLSAEAPTGASKRRDVPPSPPPCHAVGPELHGRRLRVLLLCASAEPQELWATLPRAERLGPSAFGYLDGEPALAVLTHDKIGPFVQQDLRVFRLTASRNRTGSSPVLAEHTDCPLWRPQDLSFTDADGDGRTDVLLVCEKGILDQELRVELYRSSGEGFERARVRQLEGDFDAWRLREDLTGDGRPDLMLLDEDRIHVYPGTADRSPVAETAAWSVSLPPPAEDPPDETRTTVAVGASDDDLEVRQWTSGPRLLGAADLDGDGRPEVMVHRRREGGDVVVIVER